MTSTKKRVLVCAESSSISSGFGTYTKEILNRLYSSGKYELAELSSYCSIANCPPVPWKVYPNAPMGGNKEQQDKYLINKSNAFGQWRFEKVVLDFKPDIVFDIRDYWMFAWQEITPLRPYFNWVVAPTVDSLPQQDSWMHTFKNADLVLAHTDWAIEYLSSANRNITTGLSVSDSVDTNTYKPISCSRTYHRSKLLAPADGFIVGYVARNQKRKLIPNLMSVVKKVSQFSRRHDVYLHLHTSYPEGSGWDIPSYLQEFDMHNNVLFTYICDACRQPHVSVFQSSKKICPLCHNGQAHFPSVVKGLTTSQLSDIYNLYDIYVQYAICEGLGIPQLEAAACGVPICSVDYSAMSEVTSKLGGMKIPYALFKEFESGAWRAIPNDSALVKTIFDFMSLPKDKIKEAKKEIRQKILDNYSWDITAKRIMDMFDGLESKNLWDQPLQCNTSKSVPDIKSDRAFVKYIIDEIIQSPQLYDTNLIQEMIRNLCLGYTVSDMKLKPFTRAEAVKILESFLNTKMHLEKIRKGEIEQTDDFIKFANNEL